MGESGCGKSVTAFSIMRLLPQPHGKILGGKILFEGSDLAKAGDAEMRRVRGGRIGLVFQEPLSALNPVQTIGRQLSEVLLLHQTANEGRGAGPVGRDAPGKVGIPSPRSPGQGVPAPALRGHAPAGRHCDGAPCKPSLLIADEPTTALDVTIQAQILELMAIPAEGARACRSS